MKNLIIITALLLSSNICLSQENKKFNPKYAQFSYEDYLYYYGVNDTSIAIINVFFENQNRLGVGQISLLPLSAAITIVNPPIGLAFIAITSPMVAHGLVSYGKFSNENLMNALENYQYKNFIAQNLEKKIANYFQEKVVVDNESIAQGELAILKSIYQSTE